MDVIATAPLRVASIVWQPRAGAFAMVFVCKATYTLAPGTSLLADAQDDPHLRDQHWDDDERKSLARAADLVPFKRHADVLLTGHAHAPGARPVGSLLARLVAGAVDKTVAVHGDRTLGRDAQVSEPRPFTRAPLRWERAAGGPGTSNPAGMRLDAPPDAGGAVPVPNLLPPDRYVTSRRDVLPPVGFMPLAPTWPGRRDKLGPHAVGWDPRRWSERPLPDDVDAAYFNAAPVDQQVLEIRADERLVLENLHPEHERLVTHLEAISLSAVAEAGGAPQEVRLRCDALSIDTDRGTASLTWRGNVRLAHPAQQGRAVVTMERRGVPGLAAVHAKFGGTSVLDPAILRKGEALPFEKAAGPIAMAQASGEQVGGGPLPELVEAHRKFGFTMGIDPAIVRQRVALPFVVSEPPAPVEEPLPLDAYPLERCAAITASVARRRGEKGTILERNELTVDVWARLEEHWRDAIQKELARGKSAMLNAFDSAYVAQLEEERGIVTVEQYARLVVSAERGADQQTAAELDLPRGAMLRVKRVWDKRMSENPALGKRVRKAVNEAGNG